ncbi:MAG: hypothetical protein A2Z99_18415 [Treponema sp. GWB1_62_6]|nr:MAG: hypothetical protein A2Y36_02715 [Treponema sp. GWA1_62_8]OHE62934.1 MAG: hypothetical protein A2Z99_18415 [Treponema sp. GWB1_62_6]OHE68258.1 MAG: hypothetical protein A2413_01385 [Treponema sp. RIFOXYC1_FULL_61_9]OHE69531.1 MAG: hypothetical protein A2001_18745 [Treponema sp. GWC1_61_84]
MDTIRVMVVEDDFMVADIHRQVTEQVDLFKVVKVALNGKDALAALAGGGIDLVILDVYLPDIMGMDILKEARNREYPVDFILVTAAQDTRTVELSMRYGIVDYLIKPFGFDRFKAALAEYRRRRTLPSSGPVDQVRLDTLLERKAPVTSAKSLPKGISALTLAKVTAFLEKVPGEILAAGLMEPLSLSRVTARRYLEYLAETGTLKREIRYQKVGRPLVFYSRGGTA